VSVIISTSYDVSVIINTSYDVCNYQHQL
jgi:hypothetical protein